MGRLLSIGEAAAVKGVSIDRLRRWEKEGKIRSVRTDGGHRRYDIDTLIDLGVVKSRWWMRSQKPLPCLL